MKNADKFKLVFGLYATEVWAMPEGEFLRWLNSECTETEQKKGEWIEFDSSEDKYDVIKCPCCKHTFTVDSYHWTDIGFIKDDFKFCPNCGANMRGEQDERHDL